MRTTGFLATALAATLAVAGCTRSLPVDPNVDPVPAGQRACAGVGLFGYLHGDPSDSRTAWVVHRGDQVAVVFPAGYSARFVPSLEILDATGAVVMREGEFVSGGCVGRGDTLIIDGSETFALDCGPVRLDTCEFVAASAATAVPGHAPWEVAGIRFTSPEGDFEATLLDGTTATGRTEIGP